MGDAVSFSSGAPPPQSHFAALNALKTHLDAAFLNCHHCNEWQNESQSRLRSNLVSAGNLSHINIIAVQTGKLIFVRSEIAAP